MALSLIYLRDPGYQDAHACGQGCRSALLDPDTGLFGVNAVGIGEAFYRQPDLCRVPWPSPASGRSMI